MVVTLEVLLFLALSIVTLLNALDSTGTARQSVFESAKLISTAGGILRPHSFFTFGLKLVAAGAKGANRLEGFEKIVLGGPTCVGAGLDPRGGGT